MNAPKKEILLDTLAHFIRSVIPMFFQSLIARRLAYLSTARFR